MKTQQWAWTKLAFGILSHSDNKFPLSDSIQVPFLTRFLYCLFFTAKLYNID